MQLYSAMEVRGQRPLEHGLGPHGELANTLHTVEVTSSGPGHADRRRNDAARRGNEGWAPYQLDRCVTSTTEAPRGAAAGLMASSSAADVYGRRLSLQSGT
jgi:hypothetical protein